MSACTDRLLLLHGLIDGELDAANSVAIEAHIKSCAGCAEALRELEAIRDVTGDPAIRYQAPQALFDRIDAALSEQTEPRAHTAPVKTAGYRWSGARWASGTGLAIAASLMLLIASPQMFTDRDQDQVLSSHVRSLLANHLVDIQTSNRHVVKPWFNGRIDFAPPVVELADRGFPLVGGRLDYLDGRVVPAIVYHRRLHVINLFVRPAGVLSPLLAATSRRDGYSLIHWRQAGLEYWAVSDIDPDELDLFRQTFISRVK